MRLIDADALKEYIDCGHLRDPGELCFSEIDVVELIDAQPTVEVTDKEDFPKGFFEKPRRQATEEKGFDEKTCIPVTIELHGWVCPKCGRTLSPYTTVCPCSDKWEVTC